MPKDLLVEGFEEKPKAPKKTRGVSGGGGPDGPIGGGGGGGGSEGVGGGEHGGEAEKKRAKKREPRLKKNALCNGIVFSTLKCVGGVSSVEIKLWFRSGFGVGFRVLVVVLPFALGFDLALLCLALPCLALPCLALPGLALPCLALPCLALFRRLR